MVLTRTAVRNPVSSAVEARIKKEPRLLFCCLRFVFAVCSFSEEEPQQSLSTALLLMIKPQQAQH